MRRPDCGGKPRKMRNRGESSDRAAGVSYRCASTGVRERTMNTPVKSVRPLGLAPATGARRSRDRNPRCEKDQEEGKAGRWVERRAGGVHGIGRFREEGSTDCKRSVF
jgi:hypothetical protein